MFSPIPALALSGMKRKRNGPGAREKGKRARGDSTARTRSFGTQTRRLAVNSLPSARIGKDNGLIVSNQKVPRPKKGSVQYRRSVFGSVNQADKVWIGGSSIGQQVDHFKCVAHAILAMYLPRMGDMRASNIQTPSVGFPIWDNMVIQYALDAPSTNAGPTLVDGVNVFNTSLIAMAFNLGNDLSIQAKKGYYPNAIQFVDSASKGVLLDTQLGRHIITVSCKGTFRFQNVTPASSAGDASSNINAVDANPVSGKVFTYRNQAPIFADSYVSTLTDPATLAGIRDLQNVYKDFEMYGVTDTTLAGKGGAAFTHIPAAPLNPSSVWRNVKSTGRVVFPPGGFKTFTTSYLRSESIAKYCQVISQTDLSFVPPAGLALASQAQYPPAGDSFMLCLRPTIKTLVGNGSTGEVIKMAYNTEHIMMASIKRRKPSPLQVVNTIE